MNYKEEDLSTLTEEERAAILDGQESDKQDIEIMKSIANGDDEEDDDLDDDDEDQADEQSEPVEGKAETEKAQSVDKSEKQDTQQQLDVESKTVDQKPVERAERFRTHYNAAVPENITAQLNEVNSVIDDATVNFKNGDIEFDEFSAITRKAEAQRTDLIKAQTKAEIAAEMNQQSAQQEWAFIVKSFVKSVAKSGGTNYMTDTQKQADLDGFIKVLAENPNNADKEPEWFLEEAHKRVNALHGISDKKVEIEPAKVAEKQRKPSLKNLPKTLSDVQGSDGPGDLNDEFAEIDALSGDKLEMAIAKMTPAQREKFMSQA